jgi:hypothetical protein
MIYVFLFIFVISFLSVIFYVGEKLGFWDSKLRLTPKETSGVDADGWTMEVVTDGSSYAIKNTSPKGRSHVNGWLYKTERKARAVLHGHVRSALEDKKILETQWRPVSKSVDI